MQYSLMARFRGTLLGAMLGYHALVEHSAEQPFETGRSMVALLQHLGEEGADTIPWITLATSSPITPDMRLAIVGIPLMLYYHDREAQLRQELQSAAQAWNLPPSSTLPALVLSEVLALALLEELELEHLPLQLIEGLGLASGHLATQQLRQLQIAYQERYSWAIAHHHLRLLARAPNEALPLSLLLAIYSFLRSPYDIRLAFSLPQHPDAGVTGLIVGAIAGSFNGTAKLPSPAWPNPSTALTTWNLAQPQELQALSDQLLAHWAGVYRPRNLGADWLKGAIAPPQAMRPPAADLRKF